MARPGDEMTESDIVLVSDEVRRAQRRARFDALVERVQRRIPPDVTSEQIEADIAAALDEVRQARRVHRK